MKSVTAWAIKDIKTNKIIAVRFVRDNLSFFNIPGENKIVSVRITEIKKASKK